MGSLGWNIWNFWQNIFFGSYGPYQAAIFILGSFMAPNPEIFNIFQNWLPAPVLFCLFSEKLFASRLENSLNVNKIYNWFLLVQRQPEMKVWSFCWKNPPSFGKLSPKGEIYLPSGGGCKLTSLFTGSIDWRKFPQSIDKCICHGHFLLSIYPRIRHVNFPGQRRWKLTPCSCLSNDKLFC